MITARSLPLLKTPLLCWHESLLSARNDALVALSTSGARIATTRPLPPGTAVFLELEGGASIDAVTTDTDGSGFVVEFITVDDAASVLIERALRDVRDDVVVERRQSVLPQPAADLPAFAPLIAIPVVATPPPPSAPPLMAPPPFVLSPSAPPSSSFEPFAPLGRDAAVVAATFEALIELDEQPGLPAVEPLPVVEPLATKDAVDEPLATLPTLSVVEVAAPSVIDDAVVEQLAPRAPVDTTTVFEAATTEAPVEDAPVVEPPASEPTAVEPDIDEPLVETAAIVSEQPAIVVDPAAIAPAVEPEAATAVAAPYAALFGLDEDDLDDEPAVVAEPVVAEPFVAEPFVAEPFVAEPFVAEPFVAEPAVEAPPLDTLLAEESIAAALPLVDESPGEAAPVEAPLVAPPDVEAAPVIAQPGVDEAPAVEAPVVVEPSGVQAPVAAAAPQEEVSIADALRFELDDDDDFGAPVPTDIPSFPTPAPIVEPFDDLHSDDLVDAAFSGYAPRDAGDDDDEAAVAASFESAAPVVDEEAPAPAPEIDRDSIEFERAFFANDDVLPTFASVVVEPPATSSMPRTRTDELFALPPSTLPATTPSLMSTATPMPMRSLAMRGAFDIPVTQPMGSLPLSFDLVPDDPLPPPPPPSPFESVEPPPRKETTDKWPSARGMLSAEAVAEAQAAEAAARAPVVVDDVAPLSAFDEMAAAVADADDDDDGHNAAIAADDGGQDVEFTDPHHRGALDPQIANAFLATVEDAFSFAPPLPPAEDEHDGVGDDDGDVFSAARPSDSDVPHEAIEVEVEDDEVELDHRPSPSPWASADPFAQLAAAVAPPSAPARTTGAGGVVDVDFSEFRDVLGQPNAVLAAPPTPMPIPLTRSPSLPRPPGSHTAAIAMSGATNPFGGDSDARRGDSQPPPQASTLPPDELGWPAGASTTFPAPPRLLDRDLDTVLRQGGPGSSVSGVGSSSSPPVLPFFGDSSATAPGHPLPGHPLQGRSGPGHATDGAFQELAPLPPRRPGSTSQPEELPIVVADDDLPVIGGQILGDDDWKPESIFDRLPNKR